MPVIINGSTGISGTDGSAGTPAVQGTDGNTGMFFPAADQIAFAEGGVEAMRLDASGNVGIGTSSLGASGLTVYRAGGASFALQNATTGTTAASGFQLQGGSGGDAYLWNYSNSFIAIGTNNTERARITSGGDVLIGTTTSNGRLSVTGGTSGSSVSSVSVVKPNGVSNGIVVNSGTTSTDPAVLVQANNGTTAYWLHNGDIYLPGGTAGVKTVSDKRLKRDVTYLTDPSVAGYKGLETVMALKPVTFRFKTDDDAAPLRRGWIADDFAEQMPELVTETKIPGGDEVAYKSVADGGLIPVLVSALKELKAENDALKARVAALEAR